MIPIYALLAFSVAALPLRGQGDSHDHWFADFDAAAAKAKADDKDLLVDFTGSDWCGWCIKLHDEVFKHDEFLSGVHDQYVLVALDFPQDPAIQAKVPNPERNQALAQKYGIEGYPTILLVTPDGDVFGRTGYQPGGPAAYIAHLGEIAAKGKQALADIQVISDAYGKADAAKKPALLKTATAKLAAMSPETPGVGRLTKVVKTAFELDPENASGLKLAAVSALLQSGQADDATRTAARELDPKNAEGLLELVVIAQCEAVASKEDVETAIVAIEEITALGVKNDENAKMLYTNGAFWCFRVTEDAETAKMLAKKALEIGVDGRAKQLMEEIVGGK